MRREVYLRQRWWIDLVLKLNVPVLKKKLNCAVYDRHFFEHANVEKTRSSRKVAEIIIEHYEFSSLLDIGCGMGLYSTEIGRFGKEVFGCDSSSDGIAMASEEIFAFFADVTKPLVLNRTFDLVMCFEVAEHVQKRYSEQLVANCVKYGSTVLFTAAPKGQGGVGHINEQPPTYWIRLFESMGFALEHERATKVRKAMTEARVVSWIADNFMSFRRAKPAG